jgi:hypothetical protein
MGSGQPIFRFGDMRGSALGAFLPAIEHGGQDFLEAGWLQAMGEMPAISASGRKI